MPGKLRGFSLYFQAVILAASMKNRGGLFRLLSLTFSVCLQTLSAWLYCFPFFSQKGEVHVAFPTTLRAITQTSSCVDCPFLACLRSVSLDYVYIYTYAWWLMFLGGSSFPPFLSTPFAVFAGYVSLFWIDTGV